MLQSTYHILGEIFLKQSNFFIQSIQVKEITEKTVLNNAVYTWLLFIDGSALCRISLQHYIAGENDFMLLPPSSILEIAPLSGQRHASILTVSADTPFFFALSSGISEHKLQYANFPGAYKRPVPAAASGVFPAIFISTYMYIPPGKLFIFFNTKYHFPAIYPLINDRAKRPRIPSY